MKKYINKLLSGFTFFISIIILPVVFISISWISVNENFYNFSFLSTCFITAIYVIAMLMYKSIKEDNESSSTIYTIMMYISLIIFAIVLLNCFAFIIAGSIYEMFKVRFQVTYETCLTQVFLSINIFAGITAASVGSIMKKIEKNSPEKQKENSN